MSADGGTAPIPQVRLYHDADQPAVIALWTAAFPITAPHHDPATSIRNKLAEERDLFFVADLDGAVVGTVMGGYDGHRGWIYSVAVSPAYRRAGIGSALVRHMEAALIRRGCPKVNLQVLVANSQVVAFYEQLGFAVEERVSMGKLLYSADSP